MILGAMLCASLFSGCADAGRGDIDDLEFRVNEELLIEEPTYPGNGDIEIREGGDDDVDVPDILIWDIAGVYVTRQVQTGTHVERMSVEGDELHRIGDDPTAPGAAACTAIEKDHASDKVFALVDAEGQTVLTLWERYVFIGDLEVPVDDEALLDSQVAFTFEGARVYAGNLIDGEVVAHASEEIDEASPLRRLLLGALVAGECGSNGLP